MKQFVMGAAFSPDQTQVALILKNRGPFPGLLNLVGGGVEPGETSSQAQRREFLEETGVDVANWEFVMTSNYADFGGNCFVYMATLTPEQWDAVRTTTEESVFKVPVEGVVHPTVAPDVRWMVPLALDSGVIKATTVYRKKAA